MKKKYSLLAINNYIKDRLTIDNYIENIITDDSKDKKIQKKLDEIEIPCQIRDENEKISYLNNKFFEENLYSDIESEEMKIKIKNLFYKKIREKKTDNQKIMDKINLEFNLVESKFIDDDDIDNEG